MYQPKALTLVRSPLGQLFAERLPLWRARYPDWSQTILFDPPQREIPGDFDPSHLAFGLDAFVSWRAESGDSRTPSVAWRTREAHCEISWRETPGPAGNQDRRADDSPLGYQLADCAGSLALLLLARVAADHRGELETQREPALSVTIRWPQLPRSARQALSNSSRRLTCKLVADDHPCHASLDSPCVARITCHRAMERGA